MNCLKFIISGKVQGVYYRKFISQTMNKEKFIGYVKNLEDGSVEAIIQNSNNLNINDILDILYKGSPNSNVESVEMAICESNIKFTNSFEVRY